MNRIFSRVVAATYLFAVIILPSMIPLSATAATGEGIELAPVVSEFTVKPGKSITTTIRLRNVTNIPFVVTPHMQDFTAKGEDGSPRVLPETETSDSYSMKNWIVSPGDILLEPNKVQAVAVTINVPANAEPGGHYGVIRFSSDQSKGSSATGVSLTASVGTLLLVTVAGKIVESLEYLKFQAETKKTGNLFFLDKSSVNFTQRVKNTGNVHEKVKGQVVILDSSGKKVAGLNVNPTNGNVLPGSIRSFTQSWKTNAIFGHYTATAHLAYANGKTLESPIVSFWIIPYKLIGIVLLVLIVLIFFSKLFGGRYRLSISKKTKRK